MLARDVRRYDVICLRSRRHAGQTGAGKTHTMVGTGEEQGDSGLTGRALEAIYRMIARRVSEEEQKRVFSTSVTCLEIYNEQARTAIKLVAVAALVSCRPDTKPPAYSLHSHVAPASPLTGVRPPPAQGREGAPRPKQPAGGLLR